MKFADILPLQHVAQNSTCWIFFDIWRGQNVAGFARSFTWTVESEAMGKILLLSRTGKKNKQTNKMVVIGSRPRANVWDGTGKSFLLYNCCHHVLGARLVGLDFPCNKKSVYVPVSHSTKSNQYLPKYQLNDFFPLIPTLLDTAPL